MSQAASPVLEVRGLRKQFGPTTALAGVDLTIYPGSVHALVGMNGSGKSTLVKVLSGFHRPDGGTVEVRLNGGPASDGARTALAFVHQDLGLIPEMSVLENLSIGRRPATRRGRIDWSRERKRAAHVLAPFSLQAHVETKVGELTKAEATIVAIARALDLCEEGCSVLVLDEPTSTLPAVEAEQFLRVMRDCAERGIGVLFISHQLREVLSVSDSVTVLRNGHVAWSGGSREASLQLLVAKMTGDEVPVAEGPSPATWVAEPAPGLLDDASRSAPRKDRRPVLTAAGLAGEVIEGVDLEVGEREVVGVAGLLGSGVEELGALLAARAAPTAGSVKVDGRPAASVKTRIGFVPADRAGRGVLPQLSTAENVSISDTGRHLCRGRIDRRAERAEALRWFRELAVDPPAPDRDILSLSGGNQQKVMLARWLSVRPAVLVAEEPTQGVDVSAKAHILERIRAHAADGLAVILLSGEPEEITAVCDRMLVLWGGRIREELVAPVTAGRVLEAMH